MFDEDDDDGRRRPSRGDPLERVVSRAPGDDDLEKSARGIFGYTAGKSIIADRLAKLFPAHKVYAEPFCGSAAVFFVKAPASVEVLADTNKDVVFAHKAMKGLSPSELATLAKMNWKSTPTSFRKVLKSTPNDKLDRLYKFLYLARFSFGKRRASYNHDSNGTTAQMAKRVEKFQPRYKNATILCADYETVLAKYDGKDAFHFLDPPYVLTDAAGNGGRGVGERDFDEGRLRKVLEGIKGRFLVTYGVKGKLDTSGFEVKRMRQSRAIGRTKHIGGSSILTHLLISNFKVAKKSLGDGVELDDVMQVIDTDAAGDRIMVTGSRTSVSVPDALEPARAWKSDDTLLAYPAEAGAVAGEARLRFLEKRWELDLTFPINDTTVGWSFAAQRAEVAAAPELVAKSFCVEGSRFFLPMTRGVSARETPREMIAEAVVKIDRPWVELGLQTADSHEYFLVKGDELAGQLVLERDGNQALGEKYPWLATIVASNFLPNTLLKGAPMPPDGVSALPASLEKIVPPEFRYWEHRGDEARDRRAALVASNFLGAGTLAMVDGEPLRVVAKFELYEPSGEPALSPAEWRVAKVAELLPEGAKLVAVSCSAVFAPQPEAVAKASGGGENVIYADVGAAKDGVLDWLGKALAAHPGHYVVTAEDSEAVRAGLAPFGRLFHFRPGEGAGVDAVKSVFVASFGVRSEGVSWVDKELDDSAAEWLRRRVTRQQARLTSDETPDLDKAGKSPRAMLEAAGPPNEWSGAIAGLLGPDNRKAIEDAWEALSAEEKKKVEAAFHRSFKIVKADDEHFVLGVVLEPDEVDAQKDVYSAAEVRRAAHKYMAEFQNRGHMHKELVNTKVDILESYIAPTDFTVDGQDVKKGTWVMAVRVKDATLWTAVKSGGLTGFSIGGSANRQVDPKATSKYNARKTEAKKKIAFQGIPIVIDRPRGFVQHGVDDNGQPWTREYKTDYGYIPRTKGGDGEGLDVFVGPKDDSPNAYWITQRNAEGAFDEYKVMLGYNSAAEARKAYEEHVPAKFFASMTEGTVHQIKALLNQEPAESLAKAIGKMLDSPAAL
jgi:site-specific DNA-adenine methylase